MVSASFLLCASALLCLLAAGWLPYLSAPRQRLLACPQPLKRTVCAALACAGAAIWLLGHVFGPVPGLFTALAGWMLTLVSAPWLALAGHWLHRLCHGT